MKKSKLNLIVLPVALLTSVLILGSCKASSTAIKPSKSSVQKRIEPNTIKKSEPEKDIQKTFNPGSLIQDVSEGDIEKTKEILNSSDYQIDEINEKSETPLLIAVHNNQVAIAKLLRVPVITTN